MPLNSAKQQLMHTEPLPLTPREQQVLRELAHGNSNKIIAKLLSISTHTVDGYVKDIYRKLGVRNRSMAAVIALHHGILDMNSPALLGNRNNHA
ncbi:response regulator transcription factor [Zhongshania guokunii]|uniref:Response regulator transcription factor n=1 Tax=Zhongshania guokunii TaxID=641783 RepID=A0ABV3U378_9GAMM